MVGKELVRDYGAEAQLRAENHLSDCWDWFYLSQDTADTDPEMLDTAMTQDPAFAPFDGCPACEVREILMVALPVIAEGLVNGDLTAESLSGSLSMLRDEHS